MDAVLPMIPAGMKDKKYQAVFFDAGNTLFYNYPSVGSIYARTASDYGYHADGEALDRAFKAAWGPWSSSHAFPVGRTQAQERLWWYGLVKTVMQPGGLFPDFDLFFDDVYHRFTQASVWRLYPEVVKVLTYCRKRGTILGIISNWDSRLLEVCQALDLTGYFDFIIASAQAGVSKPHPHIFQLALQKAGVPAGRALHIGDSLHDDIEGARRVGLDTLWIDRPKACHGHALLAKSNTLETVMSFC